MDNVKTHSKRDLVCVLLLIAAVAGAFAYSVEMRRPWFGTSPNCLETWLNTATILWAKQWYREGPLHLWFGLFWDPDSIEFPRPETRGMYSSYPPGGVMAIFALSKILGHEPTLRMVMAYSLCNHFAATLTLTFILYMFLRRARCGWFDSTLLALIPGGVMLFLPSPATQFQMAYIHVVVLFPFVLCVLLEFVRDTSASPRIRTWIGVAQGFLLFYGMWCDWLFAFVALCLYVKRLVNGEWFEGVSGSRLRAWGRFVTRSIRFWLPVAVALGLFVLMLYRFDRFGDIRGRFTERTAMKSGKFLALSLDDLFWRSHMPRGYGAVGKWLIWGSAVGLMLVLACAGVHWLRRRQVPETVRLGASLIFLLLTPCLMHVFVFRQDSAHFLHFFTTAKFAVPLATVPFVLLPVTLMACFNVRLGSLSWANLRARWTRVEQPPTKSWSYLAVVLAALAAVYVASELSSIPRTFFPPPPKDPVPLGAFIEANTSYEDVVFTPNSLLEAAEATPMFLAHAMKRIYMANTMAAVCNKLATVSGEYVMVLVAHETSLAQADVPLRALLARAFRVERFEDVVLYKIRKADVLAACGDGRPPAQQPPGE